MITQAELHYTDFGDPETFRGLLDRHELRYVEAKEYDIEVSEDDYFTTGWHIWHGPAGLHLLTACDPLDGEHLSEFVDGNRQVGYASYVRVIGPETRAEALYRDVLESAVRVKGEFAPLTAADGEVIATIDDIL